MTAKFVKLGQISTIDISNVDKKSKDSETEVRLCNFVDVYHNWAITGNIAKGFMAATANKNQVIRFSVRKGTVAITKDSETRNDIGIPTYIADDFTDVVLGYHCALIKPNKTILNGKYLNVILHTDYAKRYFEANASGSGQRYTLTNEIIAGLPIPLLPMEEQKRIGELFSNIDKKIENNNAIAAELEGMAKDLYDYWFVQFDFPDENGKPYKSSGGKMVWNEELKREIPEGWEARPFSTFAELITKGTTPTTLGFDYADEGVTFIKVENIGFGSICFDANRSYISLEANEKMKRSALKYNDLLISIAGRLGDVAVVPESILPANTNQAIGIVRLNTPFRPFASYFRQSLMTEHMRKAMGLANAQSIQKNLNLENIGDLFFAYSNNTVCKFSLQTQKIYEMQENLRAENENLASLRDFLLPMITSY